MVDLKWVIKNNWIGEYKWYYSEIAKEDVGTPFTIDNMLGKIIGLDSNIKREEMIEAYLLKQTIQDNDGENQLDGELKRFIANRNKMNVQEIRLTKKNVEEYCERYNLERLYNGMVKKLKIN